MASTLDASLPAYDALAPDPRQGPLPSYQSATSASPPVTYPTKHVFSYEEGGSPWLTITVSSSAKSPKMLPFFKQGQPIAGKLELDLKKPQNISSIDCEVLCYQVTPATLEMRETRALYQFTSNLWNAASGHPHTGASPGKSIKLRGEFQWQFSISLPDQFVPNPAFAKELGLPSSVSFPPDTPDDGGVRFLNYSFAVKIKRSGFLSIGSEMVTRFYYVPKVAPAPPSHLRQLAYQENTPPLGPELDPLGWTSVPVDKLHGKVKGSPVTVHISLFFSNPLTYTIGTFIPVLLTFRCSDPYTLDLLYNIGTPVLELNHDYKFDTRVQTDWVQLSTIKLRFEHVGDAKWKHSEKEEVGGDERTFIGEIPLKWSLCPTFTFGHVHGKYKVKFAGFKANGFSCEFNTLSKTEVTLVSDYAPGPRPVPRVL